MRMRSAVGVTALLLALPGTAFAAPSFKLRRVNALNGAGNAVFLGAPKGDSRLFVVDQRGVVRVRSGGRLKTFIDLRSRVESGGERGLLSIAFHPRFASNHRFFVYYTAAGTGDVTIAEGRATGDRGTFRRVLLRIRHREAPNHNGGQLQFGPDGRLWIGTGDGGGAGDHFGHAQDRRSLLGKIIRLNVDAAGARARIWGIGVRNPWRFSFDRAGRHTLWIGDVGQDRWEEIDRVTKPAQRSLLGKIIRLNVDVAGARARIWGIGVRNPWRFSFDRAGRHTLWIGDVGQDRWEEIDRVTKPAQRSLRNFGWSKFEGRSVFSSAKKLTGGTLVRPLTVVPHPESIAIVGGYVYRGSDVPALRGYYLYSDNANSWIRGIRLRDAKRALRFKKTAGVPGGITSFGEDGRGNVYVCTYGAIYRIVR